MNDPVKQIDTCHRQRRLDQWQVARAKREAIAHLLAAQCPDTTIRAVVRERFRGCSGSTKKRAINAQIKRAQAENLVLTKQGRKVWVANLAALYRAMIFGKIVSGKRVEPEPDVVRWASEGLRKLLGLDMPIKIANTGPEGEPLDLAQLDRDRELYLTNAQFRALVDESERIRVEAGNRADAVAAPSRVLEPRQITAGDES